MREGSMTNTTIHRQKRRGLFRDRSGMAAVEFAMVVPLFLGLFFSICEVGWVFFSEGVAERAKKNATRLIRTGQIQKISIENDPDAQQTAVFNEICGIVRYLGPCSETLTVDVTTFDTFQQLADDATPVICKNDAQDLRDQLNFDPGEDDSIVRLRICVLYESLNPAIGMSLKQTQGAKDRLIAQHIFRNEPYSRNQRN